MSIGSEDTFIFSVVLQTKILQPLLYGLGVYVTKPGKYAMVLFLNTDCKSINRMEHDQCTSRQQNEGTLMLSFLHRSFPDNQSRDDGRSGGKTSA